MVLLPALLFLCQSQIVLTTGIAMCHTDVDDGVLYYSMCGMPDIRRSDGTVIYTADAPIGQWDIEHGLLAIALDGTLTVGQRRIAVGASARDVAIRDGWVYWVEDDGLRRVPVEGGLIETVVDLPIDFHFHYAVFEDRVAFSTPDGLYVKPLVGGAPALLLPRSGIDSIADVAREGILINVSERDVNSGRAQLLRVPWIGAPVETVYEVTIANGFRTSVTLTAAVAGRTIWITQLVAIGCCSQQTSLIALRDGVALQRHRTAFGPLNLLHAEEDEVTASEWIGASGTRVVETFCAAVARTRAVSR